MKRLVVVIMVLLCCQTYAQRKPKIKGNRSVVSVSESLPPFEAIVLNDDLDIVLRKANEEGYSITADDNLIDVLKFKVKDGTLEVSSFYKITGKKKLDISVDYVSLNSIVLREGKMETTDIVAGDVVEVAMYGSSKLEMGMDAGLVKVLMEGNSAADLSIKADTLDVKLKDRVDVGMYTTTQRSTITMEKNSAATLDGTTHILSALLFDNANLKARKLDAEGVEVIAEGSPSARVYAETDFELTSKGSSKTYLSGNPAIEILEFMDTSQLHKEK